MVRFDPEQLLRDLDPEQLDAVRATTGPVAIHAGAGTGKTRVISRRTAYAIATDAVQPEHVLVVTFTDKAANEMVARLRALGLPAVTARTFHAHALSQLRHFWPSRHDGEPLPQLLESKALILSRLARQLPGHYRFTPTKDLADEIEWAKSRRLTPGTYEQAAATNHRDTPIPVDLFVRTFADYERAKTRAKRIDFDDLLLETVSLLEEDADAAATVRERKQWFSVDEYQDTSRLGERLLELWLGDRDDVCVVGDEDQTIYTFTGATPDYLTSFAVRWPGAREIALVRNYRSTPQVLELANRLIAAAGRTKGLVTERAPGPEPRITPHADAAAELIAMTAWIRVRLGSADGGADGDAVAPNEIAVLVRTNAQLAPIEESLTRAGIAYQVRGMRFYDRPEVKSAINSLRRRPPRETGVTLAAAIRRQWSTEVGLDEGTEPAGDEAREREASLETLVSIVTDLMRANPVGDAALVLSELERRAAHEREGSADGVNLLTYHRAKGLEWDAVYLPALEEGNLPIRQALDDDAALAEERRLLYVGITRARTYLELSWAGRREVRGREGRREPSRFLLDVRPPRPKPGSRIRELPGPPPRVRTPRAGEDDDPLFSALREWRTGIARATAMPPYVISHDSMLRAIAEARPRTLAALRRVPGMGPRKLELYGDDILEIVERATPE